MYFYTYFKGDFRVGTQKWTAFDFQISLLPVEYGKTHIPIGDL